MPDFTTTDTMRRTIEVWEGLRLNAYRDPVGIPTIGYGHTGPDVHMGQVITEAQADALLANDLHKFETVVGGLAGPNTTEGQFDALVSFSFNLGGAALKSSTLLKRHLAGRYREAADEFLKWNHAGGVELAGLTKRRKGERERYLSDSPADA